MSGAAVGEGGGLFAGDLGDGNDPQRDRAGDDLIGRVADLNGELDAARRRVIGRRAGDDLDELGDVSRRTRHRTRRAWRRRLLLERRAGARRHAAADHRAAATRDRGDPADR